MAFTHTFIGVVLCHILIALVGHLLDFLKLQPLGEVLTAPVGVRLPHQPVPLQPDIVFVRTERSGMVGEAYIEGAPDLLVKILSPSNWLYDRREKMQAYQEAGRSEERRVGKERRT